jgi:hypothetical protein
MASLVQRQSTRLAAGERLPFSIRDRRWLPLRRCRLPTLLALLAPELESLLTADLQPLFQQRHRLTWQQLPDRDLQLLTPPVPAGRSEVEYMAAVADSGLFGRERRPLAITDVHRLAAQASSGAQPRWRTMSSVQPWQRLVRCSPWAIRPWCSWQVSKGMQLGPGWWRKKWQVMQTLRLRVLSRTASSR